MPNKIDYGASLDILDGLPESVISIYKKLSSDGWKFWIVDQKRGHCRYSIKEITIPTWAKNRGAKYYTWYFCHEMAHALDTKRSHHGAEFMQILIDICPADCIEFELGYKPRNAAAAGIGAVTEFII